MPENFAQRLNEQEAARKAAEEKADAAVEKMLHPDPETIKKFQQAAKDIEAILADIKKQFPAGKDVVVQESVRGMPTVEHIIMRGRGQLHFKVRTDIQTLDIWHEGPFMFRAPTEWTAEDVQRLPTKEHLGELVLRFLAKPDQQALPNDWEWA